jgi:hypothetical protein
VEKLQMKCPECHKEMRPSVAHTSGIVITGEQHLRAIREVVAAETQGRSVHVEGGFAEALVPKYPLDEEKYLYCSYCGRCELAVIRKRDLIGTEKDL